MQEERQRQCSNTLGNSVNLPRLKEHLHASFNIKDLGSLKYFLGLEIARNQNGICLHQRKYTLGYS